MRQAMSVLAVVLMAGCLADIPNPDDFLDPKMVDFYQALTDEPAVTFATDEGKIQMIWFSDLMPQTTAHLLRLVDSGFYDDTLIHRVVDDFVIQGGDPSGTGQSGSGTTVPFERDDRLHFGYGAIGLARDLDADSGDSQWFITERPAPHLHAPEGTTGSVFGAYAMLGQVVGGMDVVKAIAQTPVIPGVDRPIMDVKVQEASLAGEAYPGVDVLQLPLQVIGPVTVGETTFTLAAPLHIFSDHPATGTLFVDGPVPDEHLQLRMTRGNTFFGYFFEPLEDDGTVLEVDLVDPGKGPGRLTVLLGDVEILGAEREVYPLDPRLPVPD